MNKYYRLVFTLVLTITTLVGLTQQASANERLAYEVELPKSQFSNVTYYDLMLEKNQKEVVYLNISNASDEMVVFDINVLNGVTNTNGQIEYTAMEELTDVQKEAIVYNISDIAKPELNHYSLRKGESVRVPINIQMPKQSFEGMIVSGIKIEEELSANEIEKQKNDTAVSLINKYSRVIGLVLRNQEKEVEPDLELLNVAPGTYFGENAVEVILANTKANIIDYSMVEAEVYYKDKLVYQKESNNQRMAPHSTFSYMIETDRQDFEPGTYTLKLKYYNDEQEWEFEETFEVAKEVAEKLNEQAVYKQSKNYTKLIMAILVGLLALALIFIVMLMKKNKKSE